MNQKPTNGGSPNLPVPAPGAGGGAGEQGGGNLMAELRGGAQSTELAGSSSSPARGLKMNSATMVVVLVAGVSAATLFAMRSYGMSSGLDMNVQEIDYRPPADSARVAADQERILRDLERSKEVVQVPIGALDKNPFVLTGADGTQVGETPEQAAARLEAEREAREREERVAKIKAAFEGMTLHSVVGGSVPVARIGDATVKVGDTVAEFFKVTAIDGRAVTLEAEGEKFILRLESGSRGPGQQRPGAGRPR